MKATRNKQTVYVAMSGGVDSSVAALLLKKQGFDVVGVFMMPWQFPGLRCQWRADRTDALRVAAHLNIQLKTWDFSKVYYQKVVTDMIREYRAGRTPNPDVLCNKHIKFGLFSQRAHREGADYIATGHYAQLKHGALTTAIDGNKDQTYFLWAIPKRVLLRTLFPIGHLTKPQVRAIARRAGLPVADKKDSQGVCFVGEMDVKSFLQQHIRPHTGGIVDSKGRIIGSHDGVEYYTIGQRHGLDIKDGAGPYYVVATDVKQNIVTVGSTQDLLGSSARLKSPNWLGEQPKTGSVVRVKIRYRTPAMRAVVGKKGRIVFQKSVRAITPGQSAVVYRGKRVLGGGIVA